MDYPSVLRPITVITTIPPQLRTVTLPYIIRNARMTHRDRCTGGRMQIAALMATERDTTWPVRVRVYLPAPPCAIGHLRPPPAATCCRSNTHKRDARLDGESKGRGWCEACDSSNLFPPDTLSRVTWNRRRRYSFAPFVANFHLPLLLSLPLRPPVSSLSVVAAASALQYIYISSGKYESLSMFDLAGD